MQQANKLVSVVITTKNEEKNIRNCLDSISCQTWKDLEIIVVDNESSDKTKEIALEYTDKVYDKGPERSAQRNFGMINVAKGDFVIYVDADMILSEGLIESCVHYIEKKGAVALHISEIVLGGGFWSSVRRFERKFYDGTVIDGARFFRRSAFVSIGGFDEKLFQFGSGEDWDIDKKIKTLGSIEILDVVIEKQSIDWKFADFLMKRGVLFDPSYTGIYHNEADFKLIPYLRKKLYYSKGFDGYINKWGHNDPDIKKQFGIYYRYFGVFVENGKWRMLVGNLNLAFGMYILRFLVGLTFLLRKSCQ